MDLMAIRRGLMAQMAQGATLSYGEFTPDTDLTDYTIDVGKSITILIVELKTATLQSGKRNMQFIIARIAEGDVAEIYGSASNATGSSWGSVGIWNKTNSASLSAVTKTGNVYTVTPNLAFSSAKFWANTTYEWYAI